MKTLTPKFPNMGKMSKPKIGKNLEPAPQAKEQTKEDVYGLLDEAVTQLPPQNQVVPINFWSGSKPPTKLSLALQELTGKKLPDNAENLETYKLLRNSYLTLIGELERSAKHDKSAVDSITKLNKSVMDVGNEIRRLESYAEQADILVNIGKKHFESIFRAQIRSLHVIVESTQSKLKKPEHDKLVKAIDEAMKDLANQMTVMTKDFEQDIRKQFEEL